MKLLRATRINLLRWSSDLKYPTVLLYIVLYMYQLIGNIGGYARELGVKIHPWLFPFLLRNGIVICPLMLGFLLMISDAPFRNRQQQFVLLRIGKRVWMGGQILYLLLLSVVFTLLLYLLSVVYILPEISFSFILGDISEFSIVPSE